MFDGCMFEIAGESLEVIYSDTSVGASTQIFSVIFPVLHLSVSTQLYSL